MIRSFLLSILLISTICFSQIFANCNKLFDRENVSFITPQELINLEGDSMMTLRKLAVHIKNNLEIEKSSLKQSMLGNISKDFEAIDLEFSNLLQNISVIKVDEVVEQAKGLELIQLKLKPISEEYSYPPVEFIPDDYLASFSSSKALDDQVAAAAELSEKVKIGYDQASTMWLNYVRDMERVETFGIDKPIKEMITILDDLERAIEKGFNTSKDSTVLAIGLDVQKLIDVILDKLSKYDVTKMNVQATEMFNVDIHEPIAHVPGTGLKPGQILEVTRSGYMIKDRVIRFPQVAVAQ